MYEPRLKSPRSAVRRNRMPDKKTERRIKLKSPLKLEKSASESFRLLIYETRIGDAIMSLARVFERHKRFFSGSRRMLWTEEN